MRNGVYYLNNSGSRCIHYVNGIQEKVLLFHGEKGYCKMRTPLYQFAFGNYGGYAFKYEDKTIKVTPELIGNQVVCFVDYKEKY